MKQIIISFSCIFLLSFATVKAQYATIPDTAFGSWLNQHGFDSCMSGNSTIGWQLDTTCPAVLDDTSMYISSSLPIRLVDGLQYFKNMTTLFIIGDSFHTISALPPFLEQLFCINSLLYSLPALPPTLTALSCSYNNFFDSLPELPNGLTYLACEENILTNLPPLPLTLTHLDCSGNRLTELPPLPDSLYYFDCSYNLQLSCLPQLKTIVTFNFESTAITCLPDTGHITNSTPPLSSLPLCGPNGCYPLGIHNLSDANLRVYPNPVSDMLYIDYSLDATLTVSDMTGSVLVTTMNNEIDVSALPSGVYMLRIQDSGGSVVRKFVKE
jgi:hypothetical protein